MARDPSYGYVRHLGKAPVPEVKRRITEQLQAEGFGILTEIDVQAVLKKKLGKEVPPYLILGACNPALSHQALEAEPGSGLLLPCNVTVRVDERGETEVAIARPDAMFRIIDNPALAPLVKEAGERLVRALERLKV